MSIAGGPANAVERGHSIGCDAIQIFTRNANRWMAPALTEEQIEAFRKARLEYAIDPVVAHSSYLINLASADEDLWAKSLDALLQELQRCAQLGLDRYVLHPGAHMGADEQHGLERVSQALNLALTQVREVTVLLETTAGQGTGLGSRFEQLAWLIEQSDRPECVGICFDTAHVLAAGYEFRSPDSYQALMQRLQALIGLDKLGAIHLNDSLRDIGSHVDRHAHIGQGFVGLEAFRLLLNDRRLAGIPMLLETPKGPDLHEDVENLRLLRSLIGDDGREDHTKEEESRS